MPLYDYSCNKCEKKQELWSSFEVRNHTRECACGGQLEYQFPMSAIKGYMPFESYYDESLDMDIHGLRHKKQIMKALGVVEAGDKVKGARNWDEKAPNSVKPIQKLSGRTLDDYRREEEKRAEDKNNFVVGTDDSNDVGKADDLPNA